MAKKENTEEIIQKKIDDMELKVRVLREYEDIRNKILEKMKWEYMVYHDPDEEHEDNYFEVPDVESYIYQNYVAINTLLSMLDKAVIGG